MKKSGEALLHVAEADPKIVRSLLCNDDDFKAKGDAPSTSGSGSIGNQGSAFVAENKNNTSNETGNRNYKGKNKSNITCFKCQETRHLAKNCRS